MIRGIHCHECDICRQFIGWAGHMKLLEKLPFLVQKFDWVISVFKRLLNLYQLHQLFQVLRFWDSACNEAAIVMFQLNVLSGQIRIH